MWRRKREPLLKSWSCYGSKGARSVQESHFWTRRANVVDYSAINPPLDQFKATFSLQQLWASSVGHDACTKWPKLMGRGTGLNNLQTLLRAYTQYSQICCCFLFLNKGRRKELSKGKQLLQWWPEEIIFLFFCLFVYYCLFIFGLPLRNQLISSWHLLRCRKCSGAASLISD